MSNMIPHRLITLGVKSTSYGQICCLLKHEDINDLHNLTFLEYVVLTNLVKRVNYSCYVKNMHVLTFLTRTFV